jgi:hypothetical protein
MFRTSRPLVPAALTVAAAAAALAYVLFGWTGVAIAAIAAATAWASYAAAGWPGVLLAYIATIAITLLA